MSRGSSACGRKRNLGETIGKVQEDIVRLRKRHDLIKYQREKVSNRDNHLSKNISPVFRSKCSSEAAEIKLPVGGI